MKFSDETLMAYADGELDAATRQAIEDAQRGDPELAQRIAQHRALRAELDGAFSGVLDEPVPGRLVDAAKAQPGNRAAVTDLGAARSARQSTAARRRWSWPEWTAIAASVLFGVFVGRTALQTPDSALVAMSDGRLIAAPSLANELSNQIGGVRPQDTNVAIAATFRATSGEYCRAFTASAPETVAGIACHEADEWRLHTLVRGDAGRSGNAYRMAGTALPPLVLQTVESMMAGDALDAEQENAARERGWRATP